MKKIAIVTATDSNLYWLIKGLIISIKSIKIQKEISLYCFDLGLSEIQRTWLKQQGVAIGFPPDILDTEKKQGFSPYMLGQFCRPFLQDIIPGYDGYIWLDADVWLQQPEGLNGLLYIMRHGLLTVSPEVDVSYNGMRSLAPSFLRFWHQRWTEVFGKDAAARYASIPMLNSGVVGIPANHPIWSAWQQQLRLAIEQPLTHLSEQLAFFVALQDLPRVARLSAHWNWLANFATPKKNPKTGLWVEPGYPHQPIHIIHLAGAVLRKNYLKKGLLYKGGSYIEDGDLPLSLLTELKDSASAEASGS